MFGGPVLNEYQGNSRRTKVSKMFSLRKESYEKPIYTGASNFPFSPYDGGIITFLTNRE